MKTFKLDNVPKIESGFKIPENYFENFQAKVTEKLSQEPIVKETKIVSLFRKRKKVLMAVAAILIFALLIPIVHQSETKKTNLDSITIENYLAEEGHPNQDEIISKINPESNILNINTKEIETQTLEDMLASNPNIENLVIEN